MFATDKEAQEWCDENPEAVRSRASRTFRKYLQQERQIKKRGGNDYVTSWCWENSIGEIIQLPASSNFARALADRLREATKPYTLERYDDLEEFERLLDKFARAFDNVGRF